MSRFLLIITLMIVKNIYAQVNDGVKFGQVLFSGAGCPSNSARTTIDPSQTTLSVLFDKFQVSVPSSDTNNDNDQDSEENTPTSKNDKNKDYKLCLIKLSGKLPKNSKANIEISFDFRGFSQVDKGVLAQFKSFLIEKKTEEDNNNNKDNGNENGNNNGNGNNKQLLIEKKWINEVEENWILSRKINMELNSKCNKQKLTNFNLKIRNIIMAQMKNKNSSNVGGLVVVDSADILSKTMKFKIITSKCNI